MACIGHSCTERRYRAFNVTGKATNVTKVPKKECENLENTAIAAAKEELNRQVNPDEVEKEECPKEDNCKCYGMPKDWPANWDTLESGVTFTFTYLELINSCAYDVTLTYDYQVQERTGRCYKAPPTGKTEKKKGGPKKKGKAASRPKSKAASRPKRKRPAGAAASRRRP